MSPSIAMRCASPSIWLRTGFVGRSYSTIYFASSTMTQREQLLEKLRNSPSNIKFSELEAVLRSEGLVESTRQPLYLLPSGWPRHYFGTAPWSA